MEIKDFILLIKSSEVNAHIYHWSTNSFPAHKALEGYYEAVRSILDNFVEVAQGKFNIKYKLTGSFNINDKTDVEYFYELKEVVTQFIKYKLSDFSDLENIATEILQEINKLNYLLTLK